jgi:hypothetical protein
MRNYLPHDRVCQDVLDFRVLHSFALHKGEKDESLTTLFILKQLIKQEAPPQ